MELTAFDEATFDEILVAFEPHWERVTAELNAARRVKKGLDAVGGAGGRPRDLDARGALAVTLASLHLVANQKSLEMIFDLVQSTVTNYTQPGRAALLRATKDLPACAVTWPTAQEMAESIVLVHRRHGMFLSPLCRCQLPLL